MSKDYATYEATVAALVGLGFKGIAETDNTPVRFFDSPKNMPGFNFPVIQAYIYQCNSGYWCVELEGGFRAPCVWNGPKADWDTTDTTAKFTAWLDLKHPGWR